MLIIDCIVVTFVFVAGVVVGVILQEKEVLTVDDLKSAGRSIIRILDHTPYDQKPKIE